MSELKQALITCACGDGIFQGYLYEDDIWQNRIQCFSCGRKFFPRHAKFPTDEDQTLNKVLPDEQL